MNNLKKIVFMIKMLDMQKHKYAYQLAINHAEMHKRYTLLSKMRSYLLDYADVSHFKLSHAVPILFNNIKHFSEQIENVICKTELEIMNLEKVATLVKEKIAVIDNKLDLLKQLKANKVRDALYQDEKAEQCLLDDRVALNNESVV